MKALIEDLLERLETEPRAGEPGWGVLVRLRDASGEALAFAGRLQPASTLEETVREALRMAAEEDARFIAAGQALASPAVSAELFLVRELGEMSASAPLGVGEGVYVDGGHRRAVYLAEQGRSPAEVLRGGCVAAAIHPDSLEDENPPRVVRLEVVQVGSPVGPPAEPASPPSS